MAPQATPRSDSYPLGRVGQEPVSSGLDRGGVDFCLPVPLEGWSAEAIDCGEIPPRRQPDQVCVVGLDIEGEPRLGPQRLDQPKLGELGGSLVCPWP